MFFVIPLIGAALVGAAANEASQPKRVVVCSDHPHSGQFCSQCGRPQVLVLK